MLDFIFGFNARLGRLHYLFAMLAAGVLSWAFLAFVATILGEWLAYSNTAAYIVVGLIMYMQATVDAMRIRDMGWDPVTILIGWGAVLMIDSYVVYKDPSLALGRHWVGGHMVAGSGTQVSHYVNIIMPAILLLWPSEEA